MSDLTPKAGRVGPRLLKWFVFVVVVVAIATVVFWSQRNRVAQRVANSILEDYGFEAARVSVGELSPDRVAIRELIIVGGSGDRYELHDVLLPTVPGPGATYSAGQVFVTLGRADGPAAPFGDVIDAILGLPATLPDAQIQIGELRAFDRAVIRDIEWSANGSAQALSLQFEGLALKLDVRPSGSANGVVVDVERSTTSAFSAALSLERVDGVYRADGPVTIDALQWLQTLNVPPRSVTIDDALIEGQLAIAFDEDAPGTVAVDADLELSDDVSLTLDATTEVAVDAPLAATLAYRHPDDELQLTIAGGGSATIERLGDPALAVEAIGLTLSRSAEVSMVRGDWRWNVAELAVDVRGLEAVPGLTVSFPLTLRDAGFAGATGILSSGIDVPPGVEVTWDERVVVLPGINGDVALAAGHRSAQLAITGDGLRGAVDWQEDTRTGEGSLEIQALTADFSRTPLSRRLPNLDDEMDVMHGTWIVDADLVYRDDDSSTVYRATATHRFEDVAGRLGDIAVAGAGGEFESRFDSATGERVATGELAVDLLEVGLPIDNLQAVLTADIENSAVHFKSVTAEAFGGALSVEPFTWHASGEPSTAMLHLDAVQLGLIVGLLDFDDIEMDGAVSGALPVRITGTNMTIADGKLESDAPGGVIRYGADSADPGATESDLGFVTNALRNFEFESLSSAVDYGDSGDLVLKMRLVGISPDVDPLQPVILNLSVENNVPQMLRSLQAVRSIQDILEQKTLH